MAETRQDGRMGLDEFLDHTGAGSGGRGFLGNWKENGRLDVWLHPGGSFAALWSHRWLRLVKDRESELLILRGWRWKCMEKESILKKQKYREDDDSREIPPTVCPVCLLIEWMRVEVNEGRLAWTDEVFRFTPEDESQEEAVLHAGGMTGQIGEAFKKKTITRDDKVELRRAAIRGDEVYKEEVAARLQYVFTVVPHDDADGGCVIAIEPQTVGDKTKKVIRDRQEDDGKEKGNPLLNPYAFRWVYDANKEFSAKYDVKPMLSLTPSDDVQAAFDEDPPDIGDIIAAGNVAEMRLSMEASWCGKIDPPWDDIFGPAEEAVKGTPEAEAASDFNYGANADAGDDGGDDQADDDDDNLYACEVCKKGSADPNKCEHCGAEYDDDGKLTKDPREKAPPKPRGRSRRQAASKSKADAKPKPRGRRANG